MAQEESNKVGRRGFLGALGGMAAAAAATVGGGRAAAQAEAPDEMRKARYRETDHVKTYYRVNGYE
ncbi:MAG: hypothetical protein ACK4WC_07905 [Rubrimonas sp.]